MTRASEVQIRWIEHCLMHPLWFEGTDDEIADFLRIDRDVMGVTASMVRQVRRGRPVWYSWGAA